MRKLRITTVDDSQSKRWKSKLRQLGATCVANLIALSFGVTMAWAIPSLPLLKSGNPPLDGRNITVEEESLLASLVFLGAVAGSPVFSFISQNYGRKIAGYATVIPFIIGWLPVVFTESLYLFYVFRFISGVAAGGVTAFCPMYVGEIAEDSIRGALGALRTPIGNVAFIFYCGIAPYMTIRDMGIICLILPLVFVFGFYWLPESPLYLVRRQKHLEAMNSLLWLRGGNVQAAEMEIMKLTVVVKESATKSVSIKQIMSSRATRRGLIICIVLAASQQLSGLSVVLTYAVSIFELAGSTVSPNIATVILASVQFFGAFASSVFTDLLGRRILIISSQIVVSISLIILGIYFFLQEKMYDMSSYGLIPIICLAFYVFSLSVGLMSVTFTIMSEVFSPEARGIATTVTTMIVWIMAFLSTQFYANIVDVLGIYGCYWLFAGICISCTVFTIFKVPETKNRSLQSILRELNGDDVKSDVETVGANATNTEEKDRY
ncbi:facilitated trehalose transporter Tret1-like [Periplaneta americana]|uniref:Major facilitator superfamily (MFS) profile domain-containing protein n=1 Tax=Periplaneta americana TaxID=6978 RepID=A0ABQ8RWT2_PERAM|nr:hypothetical protein ANN_26947 [Periplaneta americana]